jgi:TonB family protein
MKTEDKFSRFVATSAGLHIASFAVLFLAPSLFPGQTELMGSETGRGGGVRVTSVSSIPGLDLPSPAVVQETGAATPSKTLNPAETAPKPQERVPAEPQVLIPAKTNEKSKPEPQKQAAVNAPPTRPSNAIPGDAGGQPAITYGRPGQGTVAFGDESFGQRYGPYVRAVHTAISEKWQAAIANVGRGSRVTVTFQIDRNGKVSNIEVAQGSGSATADISARRAVATAAIPPLPREYPGASVDVRFIFEYGQ